MTAPVLQTERLTLGPHAMADWDHASAALARSLGWVLDPDAPRATGGEADRVFRHPRPEGAA